MNSASTITLTLVSNVLKGVKYTEVKRPIYIKGVNFITPHCGGFYKIKNYVVEVSSDRFLEYNLIGLTIYDEKGNNTQLSDCFTSFKEANQYLKQI